MVLVISAILGLLRMDRKLDSTPPSVGTTPSEDVSVSSFSLATLAYASGVVIFKKYFG